MQEEVERAHSKGFERTRSPSYPRIALGRALELIRSIYEAAHTAAVDTDTVLELMGFGGNSGPSRAALASIKQFGLIDGRDQELKVTPLALSILQPLDDAEKDAAIRRAFESPPLYGELLKRFEGKVPPENVIKSYLIRNHGFGASGAEKFARVFRENLSFVDQYHYQVDALSSESKRDVPATNQLSPGFPEITRSSVFTRASRNDSDERLQFRLNADSMATVMISGEVTKGSIDRLIAFLNLARDVYPD